MNNSAFEFESMTEREQREEWKKKGQKMMLGGFVGSFLIGFLVSSMERSHGSSSMAMAVLGLGILASAVVYIIGCCNYARGKGKSTAFGLIGLLGVIGLIILVVSKEEPIYDDDLNDTVIRWEGDSSSSEPTVRITSRD